MKEPTALSIVATPQTSPARAAFLRTRDYLSAQIIGQEVLVEGLLVALLADGHLLVEGPAGPRQDARHQGARTRARGRFSARAVHARHAAGGLDRIGHLSARAGSFQFQRGPLFHNLILADEINRAPAKVQSALLEAMAERQISVGQATYPLPRLFLVMATQNPIEQEGTYPLPEAQIDRFMLHLAVDYPDRATTLKIMGLARRRGDERKWNCAPPARAPDAGAGVRGAQ